MNRDTALQMSSPFAVGAVLMCASLTLVLASYAVPIPFLAMVAMTSGAILAVCAVAHAVRAAIGLRRRALLREFVATLVEGEDAACYLAGAGGTVALRNSAAERRDGHRRLATIVDVLGDVFATPAQEVSRLQSRAMAQGSAVTELATRRGIKQLTVRQIDGDAFLWSLAEVTDRDGTRRSADGLSIPMMTVGPSGTVLFMNDAFRKLTGGRARALPDIFVDGTAEGGKVQLIETAGGRVDCLVAEVSCSGGRRELYLLPADSLGSDTAGDGIGTAVPDGAAATGATWREVEDLPVPLLKLGRDGVVLSANREARTLLPMPIVESARLSDLLEGLGRPVIEWLTEAFERRGQPGAQFLRGTGPHQETFVQVTLNVVTDADGPHVIAVLNDATELKSLEAQFVQSQKMQAIGQLAGGVAHDFNNLLTAISGHCDLLLLRHDQGDQDYGDLIQIHQNANRAASLVGQLLAYSRKQSLMLEVMDLRDTLSDLTHLLNRLVGEKVVLTLNHDPVLGNIRADRRQLEQVLVNLVVNARDAMPGGGEIVLETENVVLSQPLERDRARVPAGNYAILKVVDRGTGIAPDKLPKIFEPFFTTKRPGEGTGLGLSTAYGIIKQSGGFIFADSEVDRGSTFSLWFPVQDLPATRSAPDRTLPRREFADNADGVILLVEDEAPVRAFASRALKLRGYTVLEADSAEAALTLLSDDSVTVDIFVTDVIMPGKDGPTWVREALKDRPETRVVFVSGYAEDAFSEHKALIPNSVFLPKPFSLNDLTETVQKQLH